MLRRSLGRLARTLLRPAIDWLNYRLAPERILENPYVSAKSLYPLEGHRRFYILPNRTGSPSAGLPVPPKELWEGYGTSEAEYLALGAEHVSNMLNILREAGAAPEEFVRVLEFGCAAGRMLRFLPYRTGQSEIWGVDVNAQTIDWCQQNLTPPFLFATSSTYPHLPFEDNYFDLVLAGSVFTHIADLPDAWFLELRRILRKGGYVYITIVDKHAVDLILTKGKDRRDLAAYIDALHRLDAETGVLTKDYRHVSFQAGRWGGFPVPQVIYDANYLAGKWSSIAQLVSITREAYGYQTALLFRKGASSSLRASSDHV